MIDLSAAKKMVFTKNNDGTYNLVAKLDAYDSNKKFYKIECNCYRVNIKNLDVELLSTGNLMTISQAKNKKLNGKE